MADQVGHDGEGHGGEDTRSEPGMMRMEAGHDEKAGDIKVANQCHVEPSALSEVERGPTGVETSSRNRGTCSDETKPNLPYRHCRHIHINTKEGD